MLTIGGLRFHDDIAYAEAPRSPDRAAEARRLAEQLGTRTVLLRADGIAVLTAPSIAMAVRKL